MRHPHRLQFLIGVAVFALVATSCGDDGDDQPDPTTVPPGTDTTATTTEPEPLDPPDPVAQEVVRAGDFEANLAWVVGVADSAPFAAVFLEDPLRLVVDIAAP